MQVSSLPGVIMYGNDSEQIVHTYLPAVLYNLVRGLNLIRTLKPQGILAERSQTEFVEGLLNLCLQEPDHTGVPNWGNFLI